MAQKGQLGAILLQAKSFLFFGSNASSVLQFPFTTQMVADLDVVNQDLLESEIISFIESHKILPADMVVILSSEVLFEKDMPKPTQQQTPYQKSITNAEDILTFLNLIPFEDVDSKSYPTDKGTIIYAVNKQLYDTIEKVFEKKGFTILAVTPAPLLAKQIPLTGQVNGETLRLIRQKVDIIKQNSLEFNQPTLQIKQSPSKPTGYGKYRLPALIGVFILLLTALPVVYYVSNQPEPKRAGAPVPPAPVEIIIPTQTSAGESAVIDASASAAAENAELNSTAIHIISSTTTQTRAIQLKQQLTQIGFKLVDVQVTPNANIGKTSVVFSKDISNKFRENVSETVKKIIPTFSVIENGDNKTITITLETI